MTASAERVLVTAAWVPGRGEPSHRSEMTTQWLCGEALVVLESRARWLRVEGPDGYRSWVGGGGLRSVTEPEARDWRERATLRSLGAPVAAATDPAAPAAGEGTAADPSADPTACPAAGGVPPAFLPWGAWAAPGPRPGTARLPGGTVVEAAGDGRLVDRKDLHRRFPPDGAAVVRTAAGWSGTPYLWGGRTREGADCSGLVQSVYRVHGVELPRDSGQQLQAGVPLPEELFGPGRWDPGGLRPGDLLFFGDGPDGVTHVALSAGGGRVLHAAAPNGTVAADDLASDAPLARRLKEKRVGATRPLADRA